MATFYYTHFARPGAFLCTGTTEGLRAEDGVYFPITCETAAMVEPDGCTLAVYTVVQEGCRGSGYRVWVEPKEQHDKRCPCIEKVQPSSP